MNIEDTLAPASDQLDAIELIAGPRTFTVERVTAFNAEQPVQIHFREFPRPWRPSKGMRRVLAACWGVQASVWADRRMTLYFDPEVTFGKDKPGGTRISHLSHIDGVKKIPLLVSRGKSAIFTVQPLPDAPEAPDERQTAINHFRDTWHVTQQQLEQRIGKVSSEWAGEDVASLRALSGELKRGSTTVEDAFPTDAGDGLFGEPA